MDKFKTPGIEGKSNNNAVGSYTATNFGNRFYDLTPPQNTAPATFVQDVLVYSWGRNEHGELGLGNKTSTSIPLPVKQLKGMPISGLSSGGKHTVLISESCVYACGTDILGLLGLKNNQWKDFEKIQYLEILENRAFMVTCAEFHTILLSSDNEVYAWGGTLHNKLGQQQHAGVPTRLNFFNTKKIVQVSCGDYHSLALDESGNVYSWGGGGINYNRGQCGHGNTKDYETPRLIDFFNQSRSQVEKPSKVVCGGYHSIILCESNRLYGFGKGITGQCGYGENEDSYIPKLIVFNKKYEVFERYNYIENNPEKERLRKEFLEDKNKETLIIIKDVKCGGNHTLFLTQAGRVYACGHGINGQLGLGNTQNYNTPTLVKSIIKKKVLSIATGWSHSMILTDLNNVYVTGCGKYGELGIGSVSNKKYFTQIKSLKSLNVVEIYAGGHHSWAILDKDNPKKLDYNSPSPLVSDDDIRNNPTPLKDELNMSAELKDANIENEKALAAGKASAIKRRVSSSTPDNQKNSKLARETDMKFSMELLSEKMLNSYNQALMQIAYTDLKMSHRFIRFSVNTKHSGKLSQTSLSNLINDYLQGDIAVMYFRLQNDNEVASFNNQSLESMYMDMKHSTLDFNKRNSYSLTIVYDLLKLSEVQKLKEHLEKVSNRNFGKNRNLYDAVSLNEDDIVNSEIEKILSFWVVDFIKSFGEYIDKNAKFLELRPNIFLV